MRKPEEIKLYAILKEKRPLPCGTFADDHFEEAGCGKKGYYYLRKWDEKGWWDYGVSLRSGWFTPESPAALEP